MPIEPVTLSTYVQDSLHMKWIRCFGVSPKKSTHPMETIVHRDQHGMHVTQKMEINGKICELSARIKELPGKTMPHSIEFTACPLPLAKTA